MQAFENNYCLCSFYCCKNDTLNCRNLCLLYPRKKVLCANTICDDCINLISKKLDAVDRYAVDEGEDKIEYYYIYSL